MPKRSLTELGPRADNVYRVLLVADDRCVSTGFRERLLRLASGRRMEALVVAPGHEGAYQAAEEHLNATVDALAREGVRARGHIGSRDPIQAADEGLREFAADEIVFVTHPSENTNRFEEGVVEAARERYELPVTHIVVTA